MKNKLSVLLFACASVLFGSIVFENAKLQSDLIEAKEIAVEYHNKSLVFKDMVESLNNELNDYDQLTKFKEDLNKVKPHLRKITLALAHTESNLNYDVKHYGTHDKTTKGIGGIKTLWSDVIKDADINSLEATSLVLDHLLERYDGNLTLALKHYKGAVNNMTPVDKVLKIYKEMI
jgi:predicted nucleotidyltransferase